MPLIDYRGRKALLITTDELIKMDENSVYHDAVKLMVESRSLGGQKEVMLPPLKKTGRPPSSRSTPVLREYFRRLYYERKAKKEAEGIIAILVVTSMIKSGIPKWLRDHLDHEIHCYRGFLPTSGE